MMMVVMMIMNYGAQIDSCYKRMPIARIKVHVVKKTKVLDDRREKKQMSLVHSFKKRKETTLRTGFFCCCFLAPPSLLNFNFPEVKPPHHNA